MNERIKLIRDELKLSRAAFGERLGVSGDVINNLERGRVEIKDYMIKLICTMYSINEDWLINGIGSMYTSKPETFNLDNYVKERGGTSDEVKIMKAYFDLDIDIRTKLVEHFRKKLAEPNNEKDPFSDIPTTPEELEKKYPPIDITDKNKDVG